MNSQGKLYYFPGCEEEETATLSTTIGLDDGDFVRPNYVEIDEHIERITSGDADFAERLSRARQKIAETHYPDNSLASLRLTKGYSQKQLADLVGTSQPHIARIEAGTEDIRISTIKRLANALNIPIEELINLL